MLLFSPPGLPAPALHHMKHMFLLSDEPTWMLSADLMHLFFHQFFHLISLLIGLTNLLKRCELLR